MLANPTPELQDHRAAHEALDGMANGVRELRQQAAPLIDRATEHAAALAQRSMDAVRGRTQQLGEGAQRMAEGTRAYVRDDPFKSVLIAAATGAALMALLAFLGGPRRRD